MAGFRQSLQVVPDATFGSMLRTQRFANNETQSQLAERLLTRQQTVGAWERGDRPQRRFLAPLADYVGIAGGEEELRGMLDREATARGNEVAQRRVHQAPVIDGRDPAETAVRALAALVSSYSVRIERGDKPSFEEVALVSRAVESLDHYLGGPSQTDSAE